MFDYAASRNQRQKLSRLVQACLCLSFGIHVLFIVMLVQFPQLLQGGMLNRFRLIALITEGLTQKPADDEDNWRTVTVLRPQTKMDAPSIEQLKRLLYDWEKQGTEKKAPPIRIRWGNEQKAALDVQPPPKIKPGSGSSEPQTPAAEMASTGQGPSSEAQSPAGKSQDGAPTLPVTVRAESAGGNKDVINLPPPKPLAKIETAADTAPRSIPDAVKPPAEKFRIFEDEQKAIRSSESGFFGTEGFPLGEYANQIKERIKGKWNIPSHLQSFQGHTTVVFYIDKNGRYGNARIVTSSGSNSFDIAALMAVIESDPFPPLPKGFPGSRIGAKFVLSWNEP